MNDSGPIGPVIEIRRRGFLVATIPMEGERVSIGRSSSSHIRLEDNRVSRSHATIERQPDGSFILIDLGSRAGTQLDGRRVASYVPMPVSNHSKIGLIEYELVVRQPTAGQPFWPDFVQGEGEDDRFLILKVAAPVASHFPSRATSVPDDGSAAYRQLLEASRILGVVAQTSRSSSKRHSTGCSRSFRWPRAALSCFPSRRASFPRWLARPLTGWPCQAASP